MKTLLSMLFAMALTACGVETAGSAATAASLKKQEIEQGKKTMEQFQQKLDQANQTAQQRVDQAGGEAK